MTKRFKTKDDMLQAGYSIARLSRLERVDGGEIWVDDLGGIHEFGYDFAVHAYVLHRWTRNGTIIDTAYSFIGSFGKSTSAWVDDAPNQGGGTGAVYAVFALSLIHI